MARLSGKVSLVTGAAQGIGEAHARRLVAEGASVLVTDANEERDEAFARAGYIRTPMMAATLDDAEIVTASGAVPVRRVGEPYDVSSLIVFLASDESAFITGTEHVIDGGLTAQ